MNKIEKILLIPVILLLFTILGCAKKNNPEVMVSQEETKRVYAVNTYITTPENLDEYLEFGGDVIATSSIDILPDATGKLVNIKVSVGDTVQKNQIIAYVDPSRPGMTYEPSPVRSPMTGTITSFPLSSGSMVSPSMSIGKVSTTDDLEISISVAERFVSRIEKGQNALLSFDAYPGEVFTAKVTEVNPVLDTTSRSMGVKLRQDPPDNRIKIGMYCRVKLITESKTNAVAVPRNSVLTRNNVDYVFVVDTATNSVEAKPVTVGITVDDMVEVISGLTYGEQVVTSGQTLLDNGSFVNIVSTEGGKE
ncbi:MAG: efflux RND transporter periplasmic adaptor subunit [Spirochaetaceae bacterium]|nr:efflux RND transporter periplasmic adaptor subunit [Spirochaetaceae bacterium]